MCYNVAYFEKRIEKIAERYKNTLPQNYKIKEADKELPVYYFISGFSHPELPVVKNDGIFKYQWGLIPFWSKNNQFAESIKTKNTPSLSDQKVAKYFPLAVFMIPGQIIQQPEAIKKVNNPELKSLNG